MNLAATSSTHTQTTFVPRVLVMDLAAVGLVAIAGAMLAARLQATPLAILLICTGIGIRVYQHRRRLFGIPLVLPSLFFLASAYYAVTIAFDPTAAQQKFMLLVSGIALYYVLASLKTKIAMRVVVWGLLFICAGVGLYFVTQTDFAQEQAKLAMVNQVGGLLHRLAPQFGLHTPHANLIAGILLLGLPFACGESYNAWRHKQWALCGGALAMTLWLAFGLFMTTSRGAWLAMILTVVLGILFIGAGKLAHRLGYSSNVGIAVVVNVLLLAFVMAIALGGNGVTGFLDSVFGSVSDMPRLELYHHVVQLNQDFFWTGAGLDTFMPTYSTYLLLINVPFLAHSHNLFLQIWFEQGIFGFAIFIWLVLAYYMWVLRRHKRMNWLALAGIAAVTMMLLHGLVDVLFYFSRIVPMMFIPFGLTIAALDPFKPLRKRDAYAERRARYITFGVLVILATGIVITVMLRGESMYAQYQANLGTLMQSQIELPQIRVPEPTPLQVRRAANLEQAEELYQYALSLDPTNSTAHLRLGIIASDRYDFELAVNELEDAYEINPNHRATIKALGYAYVWTGQFDKAEPLLKQIPEAIVELNYSVRDWRKIKRTDLSENAKQMLTRLK